MMGTMSMYYVTDPDGVVANIQSLLDADEKDIKQPLRSSIASETIVSQSVVHKKTPQTMPKSEIAKVHARDTREKIRDVLR
jgi:hypothetical protein